MPFVKGQQANPSGRPVGARARAVEKYLGATQRVITEERWERIMELAAQDAENEKNFQIRSSGRAFLKSMLIPSDPAAFLQLFVQNVSIKELRAQAREIKAIRSELVSELQAHLLAPPDDLDESPEENPEENPESDDE